MAVIFGFCKDGSCCRIAVMGLISLVAMIDLQVFCHSIKYEWKKMLEQDAVQEKEKFEEMEKKVDELSQRIAALEAASKQEIIGL